ncbi:MAG: nucleotidyl transferase AbiEii/AbiGii toxin family protein [Acidobacteria bacterium]|nr:nucleotidyl transferase AbiEii/AbiGii toxin family protein [Acidobacteriota bacterium]
MKLFEHRDFAQIVLEAAEHFRERGLRPALVEKDYYVTEVLRIIASTIGEKVIFKGGTSLSKGWNLIDRFSEDIDVFLDPAAFEPTLGKRAIDRELKRLRDSLAGHPALTFLQPESRTIGGFGRSDRFAYPHPEQMCFAHSDALFPPPELTRAIEDEYQDQCRQLCFGAYPSWEEVQARFRDLRACL